jgi:CBS domain-containing protein
MLVNEVMSHGVVSISPEEPAKLAARLLARHNIGSLPVCAENGALRGMVTDRDIVLRCVAAENDPDTTPVKEIMTRNIMSVSPTDDVSIAVRLMSGGQIRRIPVVDKGHVVGMLSLGDLARHRRTDMEAAKALSDISTNIRKR